MRFSLATATCAAVISALLAGCSNGSQGSSLPLGVTPSGGHVVDTSIFKGGKITPLKLLKLQVDGKLPGQMPHAALKANLEYILSHKPPHYGVRNKAAKTVAWTNDTDYGYLVGLNKKYAPSGAYVSMNSNGCYYPVSMKIDHAGNVWNACEDNSSFSGPAAQEYTKGGTLKATYNGGITCIYSVNGCEYAYAYGFDVAANSSYVFDSLTYYYEEICNPYCSSTYGGGYEYWPAGSSSSSPTLVTLPYGAPVYDVYYMDVDASGNLWLDYYGYSGGSYGYGVGVVENPTSSPTFVSVINPGTLGFPGGVYTTNGGKTLNVLDQNSRTITQYSISGTTLTETGTIGPTLQNLEGLGDPVTEGFNKAENTAGFGDAYGWVDICKSSCKLYGNPDLPYGAEGFGFEPSDK